MLKALNKVLELKSDLPGSVIPVTNTNKIEELVEVTKKAHKRNF